MFGNIGPWELVLVLLIALIVFGPGKLPDVAKGLGKAVNEFKSASNGIQKQMQDALKDEPAPAPVKSAVVEPEKEAANVETQEIKQNESGDQPQA